MHCTKLIFTFLAFFLSLRFSILAIPVITSVSPHFGDTAGGSEITISGVNLVNVTEVFFGNSPATILSTSNNSIIVTSPAHVPQTVHITAVDISGTSTKSEADYFVYKGNWRAYTLDGDTDISNNLAYIDVTTLAVSPPVTVGSSASFMVCTSDGTKLFTINYDSNTVSVVDNNLNQVISTIGTGAGPYAACITPDDKYVFVGNFNDNTVSVIDVATLTVIETIIVGNGPYIMTISPNGTFVLVANYTDNTVSRIDVSSLTVTATYSGFNGPVALAITPDNSLAVVCNYNDNNASIINLNNGSVSSPIVTGNNPVGVSITPDGALALVANSGTNTLSFINLSTFAVDNMIVGNAPYIAILTPDGSLATVINDASVAGNSVMTIDVASRQILATYPYPDPEGIAITPDGMQVLFGGDDAPAPPANPYIVEKASLQAPYSLLGNTIPVGSDTLLILPDPAPLARFTFSMVNQYAFFDAGASLSPIGSIAIYHWDFGDNTTLITTQPQIVHQYPGTGAYQPTLTVINSAGTSLNRIYNYQSSGLSGDEMIGPTLVRAGGPSAQSSQSIVLVGPTVFILNPNKGTKATHVEIIGESFDNATSVKFGNKEAKILQVTPNTIIASVPKFNRNKKVFVTVTTPLGTSERSQNSLFTYKAKKEGSNKHSKKFKKTSRMSCK